MAPTTEDPSPDTPPATRTQDPRPQRVRGSGQRDPRPRGARGPGQRWGWGWDPRPYKKGPETRRPPPHLPPAHRTPGFTATDIGPPGTKRPAGDAASQEAKRSKGSPRAGQPAANWQAAVRAAAPDATDAGPPVRPSRPMAGDPEYAARIARAERFEGWFDGADGPVAEATEPDEPGSPVPRHRTTLDCSQGAGGSSPLGQADGAHGEPQPETAEEPNDTPHLEEIELPTSSADTGGTRTRRSDRVAGASAVSEKREANAIATRATAASIAKALAAERAAWAEERASVLTLLQAMRDPSRWAEEVRADGSRAVKFDGEHRMTVAPSPIEGMGGFAARAYAKGELIIILAGETCEKEQRLSSLHVFRSGGSFVDAARHWSGALNGARRSTTANAGWRESGGIFALRDIAEGDELIISYGPAYWATHGRKAAPASTVADGGAAGQAAIGLTAIQLAAVKGRAGDHRGARAAPAHQGAVCTAQAPGDELPLLGLPARFEREYKLDELPADFKWPKWTHVAFHEHSGEMREAWARAGTGACSVADRRTMLEPSAGCAHFIGSVEGFVDAYPHPIQFQSSHVPCGASNWASWETWPTKVLDGSMLRAAEQLLWILSIGAKTAAEQPPSALEIIVGPPSFRTNGNEHGSHDKQYLYWLRGVPGAEPSALVPPARRVNMITAAAGTPEQRMLRRSITPRPLATALVEAWRETAGRKTGGRTRVHFPEDLSAWPQEVQDGAAQMDPSGTTVRLMNEHPESLSAGVHIPPGGEAQGLLSDDGTVWRPAEPRRRANLPCKQLPDWRADMHHNYGLFASQFAPRLSTAWLFFAGRKARALVIVPIAATTEGPAVMIPLDPAAAGFGEVRDDRVQAEAQAEKAARYLTAGIPAHFSCHARNGPKDVIVAVPWDVPPRVIIRTPAALAAARALGTLSVWCTLGAIADEESRYMHAGLAVQRMKDMGAPGPDSHLDLGGTSGARPVIAQRTAFAWNNASRVGGAEAATEWSAFVARDKQDGADFRTELVRQDAGDGALVQMAERVRTTADYLAELVPPSQGLPTFTDPLLRLWRYPDRPPPRSTAWLHRMPPQCLPPGCPKRVLWQRLVDPWGRRLVCAAINGTLLHNLELYEQGHSDRKQPKFLCLGEGAAGRFPHEDGIGSYCAWDVLWEKEADDSDYYVPLDFEKGRTAWALEAIRRILGNISDQELMAFIMQGARYKLPGAPREIRIAHNLKSIEPRVRQVSEAFGKLVEAGYFTAVRLAERGATLQPDADRSPLLYIPQYAVGVGGEDKANNPDEVRVVGDMGCPHQAVAEPQATGPPGLDPEPKPRTERARQAPHGEPDGAVVISLNDMMGPKGGPRPGYSGPPLPFPDPEAKPRPRSKYQAGAVLRHLAGLARLPLLGFKADVRHFFFQMFTASEQVWLCVFYAWVLLKDADGVQRIYFCAVRVSVVVMGARAASKICCRFAEEWLDAWRRRMDAFVEAEWLPRQTTELQEALAERRTALGHSQARPFWAAVYTDDFDHTFIGPELAARGALEFNAMNTEANIRMSDKEGAGTVIDFIGGRTVLNGGFGCLPPAKRARALLECREAHAGRLTHDEYMACVSFLGHVSDIEDYPIGALKGIHAPLMVPFHPEQLMVVAPGTQARKCFDTVLGLLETRGSASFWCAIDDAHHEPAGMPARQVVRMQSDSCTDVARPHIMGTAHGLFWRFPLTGEWQRRHITLSEACGPKLNVIMLAHYFPDSQIILECDASAGDASMRWRGGAADLRYAQQRFSETTAYQAAAMRCWSEWGKGWGNALADAGSRDLMGRMYRLAAAYGIRMTELQLSTEALAYMADVLANTTPYDGNEGEGLHATSLGMHNPQALHTAFAHDRDDPSASPSPIGRMSRVPPQPSGPPARRLASPGTPAPIGRPLAACGTGGCEAAPGTPAGVVPGAAAGAARGAASRATAEWVRAPSPPAPLGAGAGARPKGGQRPGAPGDVAALGGPGLPAPRAPSPQPMTAASARKAASRGLADILAADSSEYALCPGNEGRLRAMIAETGDTRDEGIPANTARNDEWGFKWVRAFFEDTGGPWMRPRVIGDYMAMEREKFAFAWCLCWIASHMKPAARTAAKTSAGAQSGKITAAKPGSALQAVIAYRRVQRDCGRELVPMQGVSKVLRGLLRRYQALFGDRALVPTRAEPFSQTHLLAMVRGCNNIVIPSWTHTMHSAMHTALLYSLATGTRKDEWTVKALGDTCIKRSNFEWVDGQGHALPNTEAPDTREPAQRSVVARVLGGSEVRSAGGGVGQPAHVVPV